jgi:phospholipase C
MTNTGEPPIPEPEGHRTRRAFLADGAGAVAAASAIRQLTGGRAIPRIGRLARIEQSLASEREALRVLGRTSMRMPGSLPHPAVAAGTDMLPEIEHVVVLMMENHSYDNFFGMLGRGPFQVPRGDGFTIAADGYPTATNPIANGGTQRAFRMPNTCQAHGMPAQDWPASHQQYANGANSGFVVSPSGPVAMGYWQEQDLPFTYALASTFPIGDRWFCSLLGQTDPNRRFLFAGTSYGMTNDIGSSPDDAGQNAIFGEAPPNGTIFNQLTSHGISWTNYSAVIGLLNESMNLYPTNDVQYDSTKVKTMTQFVADARAGALPSFTFIDPDYSNTSQENPQNVSLGETFVQTVVEALGTSPLWRKTILILNYDEHGGYYDHVPPPVALAPDNVAPVPPSGAQAYDGFRRYGFRVPSVIISPYAKQDYVSHVVYDHTSVLAFLEKKFNLPALTKRDANANDLLDFLDLNAMAKKQPTFPELPSLGKAGGFTCTPGSPGTIPPPAAKPIPIQMKLTYSGPNKSKRGVVVELRVSHANLTGLTVELAHGHKKIQQVTIGRVTTVPKLVVLRAKGKIPPAGHYTVTVRKGHKTLASRAIHVR